MSFQKQVNADPALGVAGQPYGGNPSRYYLPTPLAGDDGVTVGLFVWPVGVGRVANAGTGAPIGVATREKTVPIPLLENASMLIPSGLPVSTLQEGEILLAAATAVTVGQKVFASLTTGKVATGAAGATVSGHVETIFEVRTAASANDPFIASSVTKPA